MFKARMLTGLACMGLALGLSACGDDSAKVHTSSDLLPALLTVEDVASIPLEWEENMRKVIPNPTPPWENTLDPYLCTEAGTPAVLTKEQAQLELTGGSVMETLVSSKEAKDLYTELEGAYQKCITGTSLVYAPLVGAPDVGDESATFKSDLGVVTLARFGNDLMILKWWVGAYYDQVSTYLPTLITKASNKVQAL